MLGLEDGKLEVTDCDFKKANQVGGEEYGNKGKD
jgi:hypothetical protein